MSIVMIYHHEERARTDALRELLEQNHYDVVLAPLGFPVGSDEWKKEVMAQFKASDVILALMTPKAVEDEWFIWRVKMALMSHRPVIPVKLELCETPRELTLMQSATLRPMVDGQTTYQDVLLNIRRIVPNVFCFLSYSRSDSDFAVKLCADLRQKRVKVWRDADDIPAGASWDAEIQKALNKCSHLLLIASPKSVESPNVADEIGFALNKGKAVIPLIKEECELPLRVHRAQWVDFRGDYQEALDKLLLQLGLKD
jgi:hypothetical protein